MQANLSVVGRIVGNTAKAVGLISLFYLSGMGLAVVAAGIVEWRQRKGMG